MTDYQDIVKKLRPKDRKRLKGLVKQAVKTKRSPGKVRVVLKKGAKL